MFISIGRKVSSLMGQTFHWAKWERTTRTRRRCFGAKRKDRVRVFAWSILIIIQLRGSRKCKDSLRKIKHLASGALTKMAKSKHRSTLAAWSYAKVKFTNYGLEKRSLACAQREDFKNQKQNLNAREKQPHKSRLSQGSDSSCLSAP